MPISLTGPTIGKILLFGTLGFVCVAATMKKNNESFSQKSANNKYYDFDVEKHFSIDKNLGQTIQYNRSFRLRTDDGKFVGSCIRCRYVNCRNPLCLKDVADETCVFVFKRCNANKQNTVCIMGVDGLLWSFCKNCIHKSDEQICVDGSLTGVLNNQFQVIEKSTNKMLINFVASNQRLVSLCPAICHNDLNDKKCGKLYCSPESTQKVFSFYIEYL